jgi:hypothetical protein
MNRNAIVYVIHKSLPNFLGKATRTEARCHVTFGPYDDNLPFIDGWLNSYAGVNVETDSSIDSLRCDQNYARAIAGSYFHGNKNVMDLHFEEFVTADSMPHDKPTIETDRYKLWVQKLSVKEIETEKSVAHKIMGECRARADRKLKLKDAREIFHETAAPIGFLWEDVIREFKEMGGGVTDKYFREKQ